MDARIEELYRHLGTIKGLSLMLTATGGQRDASEVYLAEPAAAPSGDLMELATRAGFLDSGAVS